MKEQSPKKIDKLTLHARKSIAHAEKIARVHGATEVLPEHLLYGVFLERGSVGSTVLINMGLKKDIFEQHFFAQKIIHKSRPQIIPLSTQLKKIVVDAHALAAEFGYAYVGTEHFVYALLNLKKNTAIQSILKKATPKKNSQFVNKEPVLPHNAGLFGIENLAGLFSGEKDDDESILEQFCTFLSQQTPEPFIGRQSDIDRITTILGRRTKNNPLIIGEPGIGKTAIVEHIAHLAKDPRAPHYLYGKEIVTLDLTLLVAGTSFRGEFEQRLKNIVTEAQENENVILFIDEIHTIIGTGNTGGSLDAANILKPALARGNVRIIGATTLGEYKKHIEKDPALERRFQKVIFTEPSAEDTKKILHGVKDTYEKHHNVSIPSEVLDATVRFTERYVPEKFFPDKALDVIDETAARLCATQTNTDIHRTIISLEHDLNALIEQKSALVRSEHYAQASKLREEEEALIAELAHARSTLKKQSQRDMPIMTIDDVAHTVSIHTGIPHKKLLQKADATIINATKTLGKKIIGQDHVITTIADTLIRSASGLNNANRPHGSFLFLGSTGTGKTHTAKTLATELYDRSDSLIRVDMSELMERHHTSKLLGAPAGYIGYGEGGVLTEKVRRNPHSVILFDEIEKAHPDVFNILLQIMEDGTLTDAAGHVINFRNTIIILTSNAGSAALLHEKTLGFAKNDATTHDLRSQKMHKAAKDILPPELISRLDHIIVFNHLSKKDLAKIARIECAHLKERLKDHGITLTITPRAITQITAEAYEKNEGARSIRHIMQEKIEGALAHFILRNETATSVIVDHHNDAIIIR